MLRFPVLSEALLIDLLPATTGREIEYSTADGFVRSAVILSADIISPAFKAVSRSVCQVY